MFGFEQKLHIEFDAVSGQQLDILLLKRPYAMVFDLTLNVLSYDFDLRIANRKRPVSLLPLEPTVGQTQLIYPF